MKVRVINQDSFENEVFGGESFIEYWPEILTTGIEVQKSGNYHYVVIDGKIVNDTAFFSDEEMQYLEVVE